jgi:hypothetical protein
MNPVSLLPHLVLCFPFGLTLHQSSSSTELQDLAYGGIIIVTWLHKNLAQVMKPQMGYSLIVTEDMCG